MVSKLYNFLMLNKNPQWVTRQQEQQPEEELLPEEAAANIQKPVGFQVPGAEKRLNPEAVQRMASQMLSEGSTGEAENIIEKPELNPMQKKLRFLSKMRQNPVTQKLSGGNDGTGIY